MTKALSQPQIDALRYARGRQLFAKDVNEGNGNRRRTLLWLLDRGHLAWDPIYQGRLVLTATGEAQLQEARAKKIARERPGILRIKDVDDRRVITLSGVHEEKP